MLLTLSQCRVCACTEERQAYLTRRNSLPVRLKKSLQYNAGANHGQSGRAAVAGALSSPQAVKNLSGKPTMLTGGLPIRTGLNTMPSQLHDKSQNKQSSTTSFHSAGTAPLPSNSKLQQGSVAASGSGAAGSPSSYTSSQSSLSSGYSSAYYSSQQYMPPQPPINHYYNRDRQRDGYDTTVQASSTYGTAAAATTAADGRKYLPDWQRSAPREWTSSSHLPSTLVGAAPTPKFKQLLQNHLGSNPVPFRSAHTAAVPVGKPLPTAPQTVALRTGSKHQQGTPGSLLPAFEFANDPSNQRRDVYKKTADRTVDFLTPESRAYYLSDNNACYEEDRNPLSQNPLTKSYMDEKALRRKQLFEKKQAILRAGREERKIEYAMKAAANSRSRV